MSQRDTIVNVWRENLHQEMSNIRKLLVNYKYVAMDTEFPGVVAKPIGSFKTPTSFAYQQLRCNVDILNLIQLGISLSDENGDRPSPTHTWQFNLSFNLSENMHSKEAIDLLQAACINFAEHNSRGIDVYEFGSLLMTSGLVLSKDVSWIGFHCAYDFAYLIKMLTGNPMPEKESNFYEFLSILFPSFIDFKYLSRNSDFNMKGLQEISNSLGLTREGIAHQAGSDAHLTSAVFFKTMDEMFTQGFIDENKNKLYGIEAE